MPSIRLSSRHAVPCLAAAVVAAACVPAALADFPVVYDQGLPYMRVQGTAEKFVDSAPVFSDAFEIYPGGGWNGPGLTGSQSGSGLTGGGVGSPVQTFGDGSWSSTFAESGVLTLSAGWGVTPSFKGNVAGPNERLLGRGVADYNFSFTVTAPIIAQWSCFDATLKRNGVVLPIGNAAVWNLEPGLYRVDGGGFGSRYDNGGSTGYTGILGGAFTLTIGIPAPASVGLFAFAAIGAARRRRS